MIMFQAQLDLCKEEEGLEEKDTGKLVVLIAKNTIDETYYWIGRRKMTAAQSMGDKMTKVLEKNQEPQTEKRGLDVFI